jgi:hypothetical protein
VTGPKQAFLVSNPFKLKNFVAFLTLLQGHKRAKTSCCPLLYSSASDLRTARSIYLPTAAYLAPLSLYCPLILSASESTGSDCWPSVTAPTATQCRACHWYHTGPTCQWHRGRVGAGSSLNTCSCKKKATRIFPSYITSP